MGVDRPGDLPGFPERVDADVFLVAMPFVLGHANVAMVIPDAAGVARAPRLHGGALPVGCPVTWTMARS